MYLCDDDAYNNQVNVYHVFIRIEKRVYYYSRNYYQTDMCDEWRLLYAYYIALLNYNMYTWIHERMAYFNGLKINYFYQIRFSNFHKVIIARNGGQKRNMSICTYCGHPIFGWHTNCSQPHTHWVGKKSIINLLFLYYIKLINVPGWQSIIMDHHCKI